MPSFSKKLFILNSLEANIIDIIKRNKMNQISNRNKILSIIKKIKKSNLNNNKMITIDNKISKNKQRMISINKI